MRTFVLATLVVALVGCATTKGPPGVINADGPLPVKSTVPESIAVKFVASAKTAAAAPHAGAVAEQNSLMMFESGTTLVYANCSDFFATAGQTQTKLMVWKDAIGLLGTLAAGVIALDGDSSTGNLDRLAVISLGSSAALSGIDIYTQRFLFGAENVDAVRELTLNALSAHAAKVRELPPKSYQAASRHLFDNQALCFPARIAMLAREAIKNGDVVAYTSGAQPLAVLDATNDRLVFQDIGDQLGLAGPISVQQAAGYYWLTVLGASPSDQTTYIQPMLNDVPSKNNAFKDSKTELKDPVPHRNFIRERLARLSPQGTKTLTDAISAKQAKALHAAGVVPAPAAEIESARVKVEVR